MSVGAVGSLYWIATASCAVLGLGGLAAFVRNKDGSGWPRAWRWLPSSVLAVLLLVVWVARWIVAGHLPIFGTYESAMSLALAVSLTSVFWERRLGGPSLLGPAAALVAASILAHGATFDHGVYALTISERSWVVQVHAVAAWLAFGALTANAGLSLLLRLAKGPPSEKHNRLVVRTLELGFLLHSAMLFTGCVYRFLLFGKAWNFDPMETMGLGAWLAYGTLLHMVRFAGWRDKRLAGWCLFLFVLLIVSYRAIVYFPSWSSYHILDIDLRMHVPG